MGLSETRLCLAGSGWLDPYAANCGQHRVEIEKHYDGNPP